MSSVIADLEVPTPRARCVTSALFAWVTWETGAAAVDSFVDEQVRVGVSQTPLWPARVLAAVEFRALTLGVLVTVLRTMRRTRATA